MEILNAKYNRIHVNEAALVLLWDRTSVGADELGGVFFLLISMSFSLLLAFITLIMELIVMYWKAVVIL